MAKATYTNNPINKAIGRILFDIKDIENNKESLKDEGLYFNFNVNDKINTNYTMLIIGPEDSPYVGGYYYFNCIFPDNYPFYPMKIYSKTQGGGIRKHPNLYVCGKCCFSFLGTWSGPPWTACLNPIKVGISIRSVLINNPLVNEPGFEKKNDSSTKLYEDIVRYFNIKYAVLNIIENTPEELKPFIKDIYKSFITNYPKFKIEINKLLHLDLKNIKSPVYSFNVTINCTELHSQLDKQYKHILSDLSSMDNSETESVNTLSITSDTMSSTNINASTDIHLSDSDKNINIVNTPDIMADHSSKKSKKSYTKKCPKNPSKNYDTGHILIGEDGNKWIVKCLSNNTKRWVLYH
tara:strand:+ start:2079 stop:3131 length:1053 start_codon:yes stop_codon:yes gene_type:complete